MWFVTLSESYLSTFFNLRKWLNLSLFVCICVSANAFNDNLHLNCVPAFGNASKLQIEAHSIVAWLSQVKSGKAARRKEENENWYSNIVKYTSDIWCLVWGKFSKIQGVIASASDFPLFLCVYVLLAIWVFGLGKIDEYHSNVKHHASTMEEQQSRCWWWIAQL